MAIIDNLLAYYKLDENAANTTVADAHSTNTGTSSTNTNNLYNASGKINSAFDFLASSSERVGMGDVLYINYPLSVNCWFKVPTPSTRQVFVGKNSSVLNERRYMFDMISSKIHGICHRATGTPEVIGDTTILANTWYMTTFTVASNGTMSIYLNGSSDATPVANTAAVLDVAEQPLTIGVGDYGTFYGYVTGLVDEVGIWDKELTAAEVLELYNSGAGLAYPFPTAAAGNSQMMGANF